MSEEFLDETEQTPIEEEPTEYEAAAEEKKLEELTDADGNFKSLGHRMFYFDELPNLPEGAPNPAVYPDTVHGEEQFNKDLELHRQKVVVCDAMREAMAPQPAPPDLPDDELWKERREANEWEEECLAKARKAENEGDLAGAKKWRDRAEFKKKDLELLGPSKTELARKEYEWAKNYNAVTILGEASMDSNPVWQLPRMQWDAAVQIHRVNRESKTGFLLLPKEESRNGAIMQIKPSNMLYYDLPQDVADRIRQSVYVYGQESDPDMLFRRLWDELYKSGHASMGKPTYGLPPEKKGEKKKEITDPDEMNQREFEEWRKNQGAARF